MRDAKDLKWATNTCTSCDELHALLTLYKTMNDVYTVDVSTGRPEIVAIGDDCGKVTLFTQWPLVDGAPVGCGQRRKCAHDLINP
jgi:hypothetical protein